MKKDLGELKQEISQKLKDSDRKVIVVIDDLDRLTPEEISQMFQVIKSIADFPNVVYILAFDKEVVVNALEKEDNVRNGEEYIEKIIQLPLQVPDPSEGALENLFENQISEIKGTHSVNKDRWTSVVNRGVLEIVSTPRDVTRLANTIDVTYDTVGNEVNFVDLVGLETLRVFHKDVYDEIRSSPERFTGYRHPHDTYGELEDYSDILGEMDKERDAVENILKSLFPFVADNILDRFSVKDWGRTKRRNRICHQDKFPIYFRLSIPDGKISSEELQEVLSVTHNQEEFTEKLEDLLDEEGYRGTSKANLFIRRLDNRTEEIEPEGVCPIVKSLFSLGDELVDKKDLGKGQVSSNYLHILSEICLVNWRVKKELR